MLEVALHNPRQHRQFHHDGGPLVLARLGPTLALLDAHRSRRAAESVALVEIAAAARSASHSHSTGCEAECHCGRACDLNGECEIAVPAAFTIGDTRFEITDSSAAAVDHRSPVAKTARTIRTNGREPTRFGRRPVARHVVPLVRRPRHAQSLGDQPAGAVRSGGTMRGRSHRPRRRHGPPPPRQRLGNRRQPPAAPRTRYPLRRCASSNELLESPETLFHGSANPHRGLDPALNSPAIVVSPAPQRRRRARRRNLRLPLGPRWQRPSRHPLSRSPHDRAARRRGQRRHVAALEREAESDRRRVLLEQRLRIGNRINRTRKSSAKQREVTLLFADLRDFTELSTRSKWTYVCELLGQVMDCLTAAVMDHDGLVIDYYGDGLAAMWNAPADQADHAELACRAALRMLESLPDVAADWADVLATRSAARRSAFTRAWCKSATPAARRRRSTARAAQTSTSPAASKRRPKNWRAARRDASQRPSNCRIGSLRIASAALASPVSATDRSVQRRLAGSRSNQSHAAWQTYDDALAPFERGDFEKRPQCWQTIDADINRNARCSSLPSTSSESSAASAAAAAPTSKRSPSGVITLEHANSDVR